MHTFTAVALIAFMYLFPIRVYAGYVLPYPSFMPGNRLYRITRIIDRLKQPLYFGDIGSYKYHLGLADKYLIEAKTLFEYKQYLLAVDALSRSDREFVLVPGFLVRAAESGKDVRLFAEQFTRAADAHMEVLTRLIPLVPAVFEWTPEKTSPTNLPITRLLSESLLIRKAGREVVPTLR